MLSVVIPARNAAAVLPGTLEALSRQPVREVIVVDDRSTDATAEVARAHGVHVITGQGGRRAVARNRGAAAAEGALLAFLDADCRAERGWAEAIAGCLGTAPLVGGAVRVETGSPPNAYERFDSLWRFRQEHAVREGGWAATANLAVRREVFEAVGGFDEMLVSAEDVDFCVRARRAGHSIAYCGDAVVGHPASRSLHDVVTRAMRQGRGSTLLHRRFDGAVGRRHWCRPGGIVRGRAALHALGVDPGRLAPSERRTMARLARADYAARFVGSISGQLRRIERAGG